jgi:hypothetical protein
MILTLYKADAESVAAVKLALSREGRQLSDDDALAFTREVCAHLNEQRSASEEL